jgi:hypothetical protein
MALSFCKYLGEYLFRETLTPRRIILVAGSESNATVQTDLQLSRSLGMGVRQRPQLCSKIGHQTMGDCLVI